MERRKGTPSYIEELENENVKVVTKDGTFELFDIDFVSIERMTKRCKGEETTGLLALSIVSCDGETKKFGELEIGKFRGSSITRLQQGIQVLYGVESIEELFQHRGND